MNQRGYSLVLGLAGLLAACGDASKTGSPLDRSSRGSGQSGGDTSEQAPLTPVSSSSSSSSSSSAPPAATPPAPPATNGTTPKVCTFDSRGFFRIGAETWESISAYGRYWNFKLDETPVDLAGDLGQVGRYASGPCSGQGALACVFGTRAQFQNGPELWESVSAYGKYWNFRIDGSVVDGSGSDLTSVKRYSAGPCAGAAAGTCTFDTRTQAQIGPELWESITAHGKYWNFRFDGSPVDGSGSDLTSVTRYAFGPCVGKAAGTCTFDTRTFVMLNGQYLESITAYGRYWNFPAGSDAALEGDAGGDLASVTRYAQICALK